MIESLQVGDEIRTPDHWYFGGEEWRIVLIGGDLEPDHCMLSDGDIGLVSEIERDCMLMRRG